MSLLDLADLKEQFDGIWFSYALVHIPFKLVPEALAALDGVLHPEGSMMMMVSRRHVPGPAHFNDEEARDFGPALRRFERVYAICVMLPAEHLEDYFALRSTRTDDGTLVESVLMRYPDRVTLFGQSAGAASEPAPLGPCSRTSSSRVSAVPPQATSDKRAPAAPQADFIMWALVQPTCLERIERPPRPRGVSICPIDASFPDRRIFARSAH